MFKILRQKLQRENYLVFKNDTIDVDCSIFTGLNNLMRIKNDNKDKYTIFTFYNTDMPRVYQTTAWKFNQEYLNAKAKKYFDIHNRVNNGVMAYLMDNNLDTTDTIYTRIKAINDDHKKDISYDYYSDFNYLDEDYSIAGILEDDNTLGDTGDEVESLELIDLSKPNPPSNGVIKVQLVARPIIKLLDIDYREYVIMNSRGESIRAYVDPDGYLFFTYNSSINTSDTIIDGEFRKLADITTSASFLDIEQFIIDKIKDENGNPPTEDEYMGYLHIVLDINDQENPIIMKNIYSLLLGDDFEPTENSIDRDLLEEFMLFHTDVDESFSGYELLTRLIAIKMDSDGNFTGKTLNDMIIDRFADNNFMMPIENIILLDYEDAEINDYVLACKSYLDFKLLDTKLYEDNMNNAIESVIGYDVSLFNRLVHTNIESVVETGSKANKHMVSVFMQEERYGLKIPRMKYENHETYPIVFLNGELLEQYSSMIAYSNFFYIPMEDIRFFIEVHKFVSKKT